MIWNPIVTDIKENFQFQNKLYGINHQYHTNCIVYTLKNSKFLDLWYKFYYMLVILVLPHYYNQQKIFRKIVIRISVDDYRNIKFQYRPSLVALSCIFIALAKL